ncbi:hypothetical protein PDO_2324 [Rhizobium sp. PDO1-076]|nr:hypothetical protein PDO_2324 [Rhizobium sp. PDO1-076]
MARNHGPAFGAWTFGPALSAVGHPFRGWLAASYGRVSMLVR